MLLKRHDFNHFCRRNVSGMLDLILKQFCLLYHFLIVFQSLQHFVQVFIIHVLSLLNQNANVFLCGNI